MSKSLLVTTLSLSLMACASTPAMIAKKDNDCEPQQRRAGGSILPYGGTRHPHISTPAVVLGRGSMPAPARSTAKQSTRHLSLKDAIAANEAERTQTGVCRVTE